MEIAGVVVQQVGIMFLLIAIGIVLVRKKIVSVEASKDYSNILLLVVIPAMIINSYERSMVKTELVGLFVAFLLSIAFHIVAIIVSYRLIRKGKTDTYAVQRMAAIYSNCGFMAFPILREVIGPQGVLYGTAFVAVFNIFLWTNGIKILDANYKLSIKKCIFNPGVTAVMAGIFIYLFQIPLPGVVSQTVGYLANINTPMSMIITGVFLGHIKVADMVKDWDIYKTSMIRTILLPILMFGFLYVIGVAHWFDGGKEVCTAVLICSACPSAASTILMVARMNMDGECGAKLVAMSTLLSIATLPVITFLAQYL